MSIVGKEDEPVKGVLESEAARMATKSIEVEFSMDNVFESQNEPNMAAHYRARGDGMVDLALSLDIIDENEAERLRRKSKVLNQSLNIRNK